jgi:hypothetical protein
VIKSPLQPEAAGGPKGVCLGEAGDPEVRGFVLGAMRAPRFRPIADPDGTRPASSWRGVGPGEEYGGAPREELTDGKHSA